MDEPTDADDGPVSTDTASSSGSDSADSPSDGPPSVNGSERGAEMRRVPVDGLRVWAAPDAATEVLRTLEAGHELTIVGRRGRWVHVRDASALDAWADGSELAGVALGAADTVTPEPSAASRPVGATEVVEKERHPLRLGTGAVVGVIGALVAGFGAWLPWLDLGASPRHANAFEISVKTLADWQDVAKSGMSLGWLVVIVAGLAAVLSMVGGGLLRRVLGVGVMLICVIFVLQFQDLLTSQASGVGTGTNVWDLVDYGVLVTFGGGLVMVLSPSR